MDLHALEGGFFAELNKISASTDDPAYGSMNVSRSRLGRRPISVSNLLKKEKDGTLYKGAPVVKEPQEEKAAAERFGKAASSIGSPSVAYLSADTDTPMVAKRPRRKGDIPSREDVENRSIFDGRDNAAVIPGSGSQLSDIGTTCTPGGERNL